MFLQVLRTMAETFNSATGVEGMNLKAVQLIFPSAVEYLLESYTGGRGRFYMNLLKLAPNGGLASDDT